MFLPAWRGGAKQQPENASTGSWSYLQAQNRLRRSLSADSNLDFYARDVCVARVATARVTA